MEFLDPRIVELITYVDSSGKRRVKPPYKNKQVFSVITNKLTPEGHFIVNLGVNLNGKAVLLNLPNGKTVYNYTVNAQARTVTVIKVEELGVYLEVQVIDPTPIPKTGVEPLWDELPYESQKSLVVAWSDMICNESFGSQVNVEFDFDMQDVLYQKLIGWRSNCGNFKGTDDSGRAKAPTNKVADPLPLEPTPPIEPPVIPTEPEPPVCVNYMAVTLYEWDAQQVHPVRISRSDLLSGASVASTTGCKYAAQLVRYSDKIGISIVNTGYVGTDTAKASGARPYTDLVGAQLELSDGSRIWISSLLAKTYAEMDNPNLIFGDKSMANGSSAHVAVGKLNDYAVFGFGVDESVMCSTHIANFSPPAPVVPPQEGNPIDINHNYDVAFILRWENNTRTDLDFIAVVDGDPSKTVTYSRPKYTDSAGTLWLDHDYTSHGSTGYTSEPEVISILKFSTSRVTIKINNYNGGAVTQNPVVEVVTKDGAILASVTVPASRLSGTRATIDVLDYSVATKRVTPKV